jgi:hypothetical protein
MPTISLIRHLWGYAKPLESTIVELKTKGYVGIESPMPDAAKRDAFTKLLRDHGMRYIGMAFTGGSSPAEHFDSMRSQVDELLKMGASQITIHSGRDAFSRAESESFFEKAMAFEQGVPVVVAHETHRGRILFNPWITRDLLVAFPKLRLCCDYSHWVCVAERLIDDCADILSECAKRCAHLHARVGYEQGPQVPDPSAPEYAGHLAAHERWWKQIAAARGDAELTVTPEFGPPGYLHTLPHTNLPVADLEKVCDWVAGRVREKLR